MVILQEHLKQQEWPFLHASTISRILRKQNKFSCSKFVKLSFNLCVVCHLGCRGNMWHNNCIFLFSKTRFHPWLILCRRAKQISSLLESVVNHKWTDPCIITSKTSRPTRNIGFAFRCSTKAASSITGPRLAFTSTASCRRPTIIWHSSWLYL